MPHQPHEGRGPPGEGVWSLPCPARCVLLSRRLNPPRPASLLQGTSRPTRSLSTAQLVQPSGGLQASVISNIVLMKGQAKVSKGRGQQKLLDGHELLRSCPSQGRDEVELVIPAAGFSPFFCEVRSCVRPRAPVPSLGPWLGVGTGPRQMSAQGIAWNTPNAPSPLLSPGPGLQHRWGKGQHLWPHWNLRQNHLCGGSGGGRWKAAGR